MNFLPTLCQFAVFAVLSVFDWSRITAFLSFHAWKNVTAVSIRFWEFGINNLLLNFQVQGKYYYRIDPLGEGAKWRRTFGQEIYSPLLLAFSEKVKFNSRKEKVVIGNICINSYSYIFIIMVSCVSY